LIVIIIVMMTVMPLAGYIERRRCRWFVLYQSYTEHNHARLNYTKH